MRHDTVDYVEIKVEYFFMTKDSLQIKNISNKQKMFTRVFFTTFYSCSVNVMTRSKLLVTIQCQFQAFEYQNVNYLCIKL